MIKRTDFLFSKEDEELFSEEIMKITPNIVFMDNIGNHFYLTPSERKTLFECESNFVGILNKDLFPVIEKNKTALIFMNRSNSLDPTSILPNKDFISTGTLSIMIDESDWKAGEMMNFVKEVWKVLKKITTRKIKVVSLETGEVINDKPFNVVAGLNAISWCKAKPRRFFKFRSVQVYMKPADK